MTALDELTRSGRGAASNRGTQTPSGAGSNSGMQMPSTGESSGVTSPAGSRSAVESLRGTAAGNDSPIPLTDPSGLQNGVDPTSRSANNQQTGSGLMLPSIFSLMSGLCLRNDAGFLMQLQRTACHPVLGVAPFISECLRNILAKMSVKMTKRDVLV